MTETIVRASYTSSYADCPRRAAARIFENEITAMGYGLRRLPPHIGAVVGTATHVAVYSALAAKIETGELGNATEAEQRALEQLGRDTNDGVMWDAVTTTIGAAEKQVLRQARIYRQHVATHIQPTMVERRINAPTGRGVTVSGQVDVYDEAGTLVGDLKTGKMSRWNAPQYGTYSRLLRTEGHPVKRIEEHYVPRVALDQEQPRPEIIAYDVATAEHASAAVIRHIEDDLATFRASGSPDAFLPNPYSVLCSDKFCTAWGTTWCSAWRRG